MVWAWNSYYGSIWIVSQLGVGSWLQANLDGLPSRYIKNCPIALFCVKNKVFIEKSKKQMFSLINYHVVCHLHVNSPSYSWTHSECSSISIPPYQPGQVKEDEITKKLKDYWRLDHICHDKSSWGAIFLLFENWYNLFVWCIDYRGLNWAYIMLLCFHIIH